MNKILYLLIISLYCTLAFSQTNDTTNYVIRSATDLKTGNTEDALVSFMQLAIKDLQNTNSFQFTSSLLSFYGNKKSNQLVDTNYLRNPFLRNSNFGIALGSDQNHKINNVTFNVKYAILNNRDSTIFYTAGNYPRELDSIEIHQNLIINDIQNNYLKIHPEEREIVLKYIQIPIGKIKYSELSDKFKEYFNDLLKRDTYFKDVSADQYTEYISNSYKNALNNFSNKSLLTISGSYSVDPRTNITLEYLKGITNPDRNGLELNIKGSFDNIDTIVNSESYQRYIVNGSIALNWIIVRNVANQSIAELKVGSLYKHISKVFADEKTDTFTAEGTLRFRISKNIWLPLDFSYDPKKGNVFGFINITTNFDAIRGLL